MTGEKMLQKILSIQSVGKFHNYSPQGDVQLRFLNLVFGENGRGKTTLAAILRSLTTNNPNFILERKTIGSSTPIQVRILDEQGVTNFTEGNNWDRVIPDIEIYTIDTRLL